MGKTLAAWLLVAGAVASTTPGPRDVIQAGVARVIQTLQEGGQGAAVRPARAAAERQRAEIRKIAAEMFDFDELARRALSRHWASRSAEEQSEFVRLFTDLLERAYVARIETYAGERIVWGTETVDGGYATVRSRIVTRRQTETPVDYRLHLRDGHWKVYDVLIDGVSFVATYRTQFDRIITLESYASLVDRMRRRALGTTTVERTLRGL